MEKVDEVVKFLLTKQPWKKNVNWSLFDTEKKILQSVGISRKMFDQGYNGIWTIKWHVLSDWLLIIFSQLSQPKVGHWMMSGFEVFRVFGKFVRFRRPRVLEDRRCQFTWEETKYFFTQSCMGKMINWSAYDPSWNSRKVINQVNGRRLSE